MCYETFQQLLLPLEPWLNGYIQQHMIVGVLFCCRDSERSWSVTSSWCRLHLMMLSNQTILCLQSLIFLVRLMDLLLNSM